MRLNTWLTAGALAVLCGAADAQTAGTNPPYTLTSFDVPGALYTTIQAVRGIPNVTLQGGKNSGDLAHIIHRPDFRIMAPGTLINVKL
jgi:hypothetical protein